MALCICNRIQTVIILQEQFHSTTIQCLSQNFFHNHLYQVVKWLPRIFNIQRDSRLNLCSVSNIKRTYV